MSRTFTNLTDRRFGSLVAVAPSSKDMSGNIRWRCQCDCGATHNVLALNLKTGRTTRCPACRRTRAAADRALIATVVRTFAWNFGQEGGYAVAYRPDGTALVCTHWSRQPVGAGPGKTRMARRCMHLLFEAGLVPSRTPGYGLDRWARAAGVIIEPIHLFQTKETLQQRWDALEAQGVVRTGQDQDVAEAA